MNIWKAFNKLKKDIKEKSGYIQLYDVMLDGMLVVSSISEIKRSRDERRCSELYNTVRNYFNNKTICFSPDRFNYLLKYLIENDYNNNWYKHNVFYVWKLNMNSLHIKEHIAGRKILLWGLGERGYAFLKWASDNYIKVNYIYDQDITKTYKLKDSYRIILENDIGKLKNCIIIASNYSICEYIYKHYKDIDAICIQEWCSY